ncbi:hypothetical protein ACS0TY_001760 [Phlomoides rotata]
MFEPNELTSWSFYCARIAEFIATFLFLYVTILTVMEVSKSDSKCATVEIKGIAWAIGGMIFALVLHRWDLRWAHKSGGDVRAFSGPKIVAGEGKFLYGDAVLRSDLWSWSSERVREESVYDQGRRRQATPRATNSAPKLLAYLVHQFLRWKQEKGLVKAFQNLLKKSDDCYLNS